MLTFGFGDNSDKDDISTTIMDVHLYSESLFEIYISGVKINHGKSLTVCFFKLLGRYLYIHTHTHPKKGKKKKKSTSPPPFFNKWILPKISLKEEN